MRVMFTDGQAIEALHAFFGLQAPASFDDVKTKYRLESKKLHPDAGGSEEDFKALSNAFGSLRKLYEAGSQLFKAEPLKEGEQGDPNQPAMPRTTVDGVSLSALGLGLGPTTNGRECTHCNSQGYTITRDHVRPRCLKCNGTGVKSGSFRFSFFAENYCVDCNGSGRGPDRVAQVYAMKCHDCKGTGEIEVLNPVIPKGRLAFTGKKSEVSPEVSVPVAAKQDRRPGKDRLFKPTEPVQMGSLLEELKRAGVGGKR